MTGRIKSYNPSTSTGCIESENGVDVRFDASVVVAYDVGWLGVGQAVTFQQSKSSSSHASYVSVETPRAFSAEVRKEHPLLLRYLGFDQQQNIRCYRFERVVPGQETMTFTVTTDLALFTRYHIGIQEGPAICRALLVNGILAGKHTGLQVTEPDLQAFLAARVIPAKKNFKKRASAAASAGA